MSWRLWFGDEVKKAHLADLVQKEGEWLYWTKNAKYGEGKDNRGG